MAFLVSAAACGAYSSRALPNRTRGSATVDALSRFRRSDLTKPRKYHLKGLRQEAKKLSQLSIRRVSYVGAVSFSVLAIAACVALISITSALERTIDTVVRDTKSQAVANQLQVNLLTYQMLSNLYVLTEESELDTARNTLASQMHASLLAARDHSGGSEEHELLDLVAQSLSAYLQRREEAEARGLGLQESVRASSSELNAAVESIDALRNLNRSQVDRVQASAQRLDGFANLIGWIVSLILMVGFLLMVLAVRRYLLRPLLDLHGTMARFRSGVFGARSTAGGAREIAELTERFNEMADSLSQQRQEQLAFLAGIAHDLRTPLNGITLGVYALEREQSPENRARAREGLDRQVERLSRMVEDLLDASRIEAGALELREELLDLREVVEGMVGLYAQTTPEHHVRAELPAEAVWVFGDPLRLEQVVSNLLSNAIKFSPGGGSITVSVEIEQGEVTLAVCDQGIGISPEEVPDLFLPFRRRKQDRIPGSGLGLSVVRRIVSAHGGSIDVESEPGRGATFRVRLPLRSEGRARVR